MEKLSAFLAIARELNSLGITPLLMGSLGLELRTGRDWQARDIDIHVPGDPRGWEAPDEERITHLSAICQKMEKLGYAFVDPHEHTFVRQGIEVEFGVIDTLPAFAGVPLAHLEIKQVNGVLFFLPTESQYLAIYRASSKDSYRQSHNNYKDLSKIAYLEEKLGQG